MSKGILGNFENISHIFYLNPFLCKECVKLVGLVEVYPLLGDGLDLVHEPHGVVGDRKAVVTLLFFLKSTNLVRGFHLPEAIYTPA